MSWRCVVCTDAMTASQDVKALHCGHVYHNTCLQKWTSTAKNCPQCRHPISGKHSAIKLFLTESQDGDVSKDAIFDGEGKISELNKQLSKLQQQMMKKEKEIKRLKDKMNTYTDINTVLKREVEEVQSLRSENEVYREELRKNRRQMQTYRGLQVVIDGCQEEINKKLKEDLSNETLVQMFCLHLKQLSIRQNRIKDLEGMMMTMKKKMKDDMDRKEKEVEGIREKLVSLEEDNEALLKENDKLKLCNNKLKTAIESPRHTTTSLLHRLFHESPAPLNLTIPTPASETAQSDLSKLNLDISFGAFEKSFFSDNGDSNKEKINNSFSEKRRLDEEPQQNKKIKTNNHINVNNNNNNDRNTNNNKNNEKNNRINNNNSKPENTVLKSIQNNSLQNMKIFKKHPSMSRLGDTTKPSSSSLPSSSGLRYGYNGLGFKEKFIVSSKNNNNRISNKQNNKNTNNISTIDLSSSSDDSIKSSQNNKNNNNKASKSIFGPKKSTTSFKRQPSWNLCDVSNDDVAQILEVIDD